MKKFHSKKGLAILFLFLLSSCESSYEYKYSISNKANSTITIFYSTYSNDSVIKIAPGETKELFKTSHGIEGSGGPFQRDIRKDLKTIEVKIGTTDSAYNIRDNKFWTFEKISSYNAKYNASINGRQSY